MFYHEFSMCSFTLIISVAAISSIQVSAQEFQGSLQDFGQFAHKLIETDRSYFKAPPDDYSSRDTFDFVIVGAGAAGSVLTARLSEVSDFSVLLLEAGEDEVLLHDIPLYVVPARSTADWNYVTVPMENGCPRGEQGKCPYPRGKVMGGSTTTNYMTYARGNPKDYDAWAEAVGDQSWSYNKILYYFKKSEKMMIPALRNSEYHGTKGSLPISYLPFTSIVTPTLLEAAEELGIPEVDYNGAYQEGVARIQTFSSDGSRWSTNRGHLWDAAHRDNLFVRKHSLVSKILFKGRRATGVRYERDGRTHTAYATKEVIICAGAVNTPQLLMLSGIGPRAHLQEFDIPVILDAPVGHNFQDHSIYIGQPITLNTSVGANIASLVNFQNYIELVINSSGPLTNAGGVEMLYFFQAGDSPGKPTPNMELYFLNILPFPNQGFSSEDIYQNIRQSNAILPCLMPRYPRSKGNITLASKSIHEQPNIFPNFFAEEQDITNAVEGVKKMLSLLDTVAFKRIGATAYSKTLPRCNSNYNETDEYLKCAIKTYSLTSCHSCCSVKMGKSEDKSAVVTSDFTVKGIQNLRVVDASVFPEIVSGHLEAPTVMMAEKAADIIKKKYLHYTLF